VVSDSAPRRHERGGICGRRGRQGLNERSAAALVGMRYGWGLPDPSLADPAATYARAGSLRHRRGGTLPNRMPAHGLGVKSMPEALSRLRANHLDAHTPDMLRGITAGCDLCRRSSRRVRALTGAQNSARQVLDVGRPRAKCALG